MSYVDYIDRTVDIAAFHGLENPNQPLTMQLVTETSSGEILTGILKLAQKFLLLFFTEQGSVKHLPTYGTEFMVQARQGFLRTEIDVRAAFAEALIDIAEQLREEEDPNDPDDEKFDTAELISVVVEPGFVAIYCRLLSQAGTARTLIMPLDTSL